MNNPEIWTGVEVTDRGPWCQTISGRRFYPLDFRPEEIWLSDISHALLKICRYGGHVTDFYSVGMHSLAGYLYALYDLDDQELADYVLLHDATEAYVGDMIRPLKQAIPLFCQIENKVWDAIAQRFQVNKARSQDCKLIDDLLLVSEKSIFLPKSESWPNLPNKDSRISKRITEAVWDYGNESFQEIMEERFGRF